jgi:hypothetical protein
MADEFYEIPARDMYMMAPGSKLTIPPLLMDLSSKLPLDTYSVELPIHMACMAIAFAKLVKDAPVPDMTAVTGTDLETALRKAVELKLVRYAVQVRIDQMVDVINAIAFGNPILFEGWFLDVEPEAPRLPRAGQYRQVKLPTATDSVLVKKYVLAVGYTVTKQALICSIDGEVVLLPFSYLLNRKLVTTLWTVLD